MERYTEVKLPLGQITFSFPPKQARKQTMNNILQFVQRLTKACFRFESLGNELGWIVVFVDIKTFQPSTDMSLYKSIFSPLYFHYISKSWQRPSVLELVPPFSLFPLRIWRTKGSSWKLREAVVGFWDLEFPELSALRTRSPYPIRFLCSLQTISLFRGFLNWMRSKGHHSRLFANIFS